MKIGFDGEIRNGVFVPKSDIYYRHHLKKFEGKPVGMVLVPKTRKRSLNQNAYYWFCIGIICETTGDIPEDLHRIFKSKFCPRKFIKYRGKDYQMPKSSADLTTTEFGNYLDLVKQEAAEMGINLPEANELYNI